jgi:hypothetical protein
MLNVIREILTDSKHTLRLWSRRPALTALAVLTLAIGIGTNTGIFSVVNALLLRSLPFRDPQQLVAMRLFFPPHDSAVEFHAWRVQSTYLADAALTEHGDANLGAAGDWRRVHIAQVSWNLFSLLGIQAVLGRTFAAGEDVRGQDGIAVISYGLWQQLYAGDPKVLGSVVHVNGNPLKILGVAPSGFDYPNGSVLWKPATFTPGNNGWDVIGRLQPDLSLAQAGAAFTPEAERRWIGRAASDKAAHPPEMVSLRDEFAGSAKDWVADSDGGRGSDPADRLRQRRKLLDGRHHGSVQGAFHSLRARRLANASATPTAH